MNLRRFLNTFSFKKITEGTHASYSKFKDYEREKLQFKLNKNNFKKTCPIPILFTVITTVPEYIGVYNFK